MMPDPRPPERVGTMPDRAIVTAETVTLEVSPYFRDPDGGGLTYGATTSDAGVVSVMQAARVLTIVGVGEGTVTVAVTATDADHLTVTQSFRVTVERPNRPPEAADTIPPQRLIVGPPTVLPLTSYFRDSDGDALSYGAVSSRDRVVVASVSEGRLILVGIMPGTATATVMAADPAGLTATQTVRITVEAPNQAPRPQGTIEAQRVAVGDTAHLDVATYFRDPDGDTLSYRAASSDEAVASAATAGDTLTLLGFRSGTASVTVTAADPDGLMATQTAVVTVTAGSGGFRDDFDSDASLDDWRLADASATVREGVLQLRSSPGAQVGRMFRPLPLPLSSWTIRTSMGRATQAEVSVAWFTGHSRHPAFRFEIGNARLGFDYIFGDRTPPGIGFQQRGPDTRPRERDGSLADRRRRKSGPLRLCRRVRHPGRRGRRGDSPARVDPRPARSPDELSLDAA